MVVVARRQRHASRGICCSVRILHVEGIQVVVELRIGITGLQLQGLGGIGQHGFHLPGAVVDLVGNEDGAAEANAKRHPGQAGAVAAVLAVADLEVPFLAEQAGEAEAVDVALLLDLETAQSRVDCCGIIGAGGRPECCGQGQVAAAQAIMDEGGGVPLRALNAVVVEGCGPFALDAALARYLARIEAQGRAVDLPVLRVVGFVARQPVEAGQREAALVGQSRELAEAVGVVRVVADAEFDVIVRPARHVGVAEQHVRIAEQPGREHGVGKGRRRDQRGEGSADRKGDGTATERRGKFLFHGITCGQCVSS